MPASAWPVIDGELLLDELGVIVRAEIAGDGTAVDGVANKTSC